MSQIINFDELNINKKYILDRISEEDIFKFYFKDFEYKKFYKSPLRDDDNTPSFNIIKNNIGINYKDFGNTSGNCFEFVKNLYNCDYLTAIKKIAFDFKLSKKDVIINQKPKTQIYEPEFEKQIIPVKKAFNLIDYNYWMQYYIDFDRLFKENIYACKLAYLKRDVNNMYIWAQYMDNNPLYCFELSGKHKLYRPLADKKFKWLSTASLYEIQGLTTLPEKGGDLLVIKSSMKDKLVMNVLGYDAIAPGGEDIPIPAKIMDYLWDIYPNIVCFYDNDEAGKKGTEKFCKENPGVIPIYYPDYVEQKDISDYISINKLKETKKLIKSIL